MVQFRVSKNFYYFSVILHGHYSKSLYFFTFAFRKKHGLVRNDFLDCMMELRQASKNEGQGDVQSAENANTGDMISKLKQHFIL